MGGGIRGKLQQKKNTKNVSNPNKSPQTIRTECIKQKAKNKWQFNLLQMK